MIPNNAANVWEQILREEYWIKSMKRPEILTAVTMKITVL
jgi:hypothetical protein